MSAAATTHRAVLAAMVPAAISVPLSCHIVGSQVWDYLQIKVPFRVKRNKQNPGQARLGSWEIRQRVEPSISQRKQQSSLKSE